MEKIFITGITGQDGLFLTSKLLRHRNIKIYGCSRDLQASSFYKKLELLNAVDTINLKIVSLDLLNLTEITTFVKDVRPDVIVNLSGPSSVYESIGDNRKSYNEITSIYQNLTDAVMKNNLKPIIFQASSSEMFKKNDSGIFDEKSQLEGLTPYAEAKIKNHQKSIILNKDLGLKTYSGIMFNHESEFREDAYLIMQIINSAKKILMNKGGTFTIGSLDLERDWSFAGDVAEAILQIINNGKSNSYVIGSGVGKSIKEVVQIIFQYFGLEYEEFLVLDATRNRKNNIKKIVSNPAKIKKELGWKSNMILEDLIVRCIEKKFKD